MCITIILSSCDRINPVDKGHPAYFDKIIQHGDSLINTNYNKGIKYLDSAYKAFPKPSNFDLSRKYKTQAEYSLNPNEGLIYIDSALVILEKQIKSHPVELFTAYNVKANLYVDKDDYDNAFKYFYNAKVLSEKISLDNGLRGFINMSIGNVLFKQKKYNEALGYFRISIQYYKKTTVKPFNAFGKIQSNLNSIGLCYERLNQLDSANIAYQNALAYVNSVDKKFLKHLPYINAAKGVIYGNIASNYVHLKAYKKAEEAFVKSLALDKIYLEDILFNQIKLAQLYLNTDRKVEAANLINTIRKRTDSLTKPSREVNLRFSALVWNYYEDAGDVPQAYKAFKAYHKLKDSADLVDSQVKSKDINKEFVKYAQTQEIDVLKKKDELKTVYLIFALSLTFLSALVIFLIWRNYRITRKNNTSLKVLNAKISDHNLLMEKTLEALEQSQEENTHMMQVVAHDMRTPIAGVIGLTSLMLEENDLTEDQREIISMINTSGADTLNFINDLLQVQYNKSNLIKEPVEMHTLLKYCITLLDSKAKEKHQELKISTIPIEINISREKIWRVMSNLISNAIKFSPHGTTIHIVMEEKPLSILIAVKDNGIGIPPEIAQNLFAMNADVQRQGTDGEKSFGLGLAISKQIIEAHNGSIWFESLPGFGTTFFVELPITEN
ncbi:ATP-binding protein [Pedobacter sp. Hv1]|uniref:tetratricopeptide repeat-containing sensor histidine kinase n=1 Tax=Pedobacter sp. Hv1 TaxID=1740090 RepID=UPI00137918C7|nr:ATP-binding protein [Pedobacter sp. Hv1]